MPATVAPGPGPGPGPGPLPGSALWAPWEQTGPRLRPEQWQFALHASRPLTDEELDRLIRLNAALGRAAIVLARPSSWPAVRPPWYNVDLSQTLKQPSQEHKSRYENNLPFPPTPQKPLPPWWEGWLPAAAILFTLLLLVARGTERCISNRLKRRRALLAARARAPPFEEWPTPNVRATAAPGGSPQTTRLTVEIPPPPPYSETDADPAGNTVTVSDFHLQLLRGLTRDEQISFLRVNYGVHIDPRRRVNINTNEPSSIPFRNFEELCQIRQMMKRNRELQPPPSYSSVMLDEAPPYSSVVFNNDETPSVHFTNSGRRVDDLENLNLNLTDVNLANLNPEMIETEVLRVDDDIQGAPVNFNNAQAHENVQRASVNSNTSQGTPVNVNTNINPSYNNLAQGVPSYATRHVDYVTNYDENLTAHDVARGMADALEDEYEELPDNPSSAYERHFVPESDADVVNKSLAITESLLANSDVLKRHRRYEDPIVMRRTLQREVEALADQDRDEMVTFGDINDEDVIRNIDESDEAYETVNARERDVELQYETAIDLDNEINAQYEAMEQDNIEVDIAGANDFDDDAKRALDFAETQIDDKSNPKA